MKIRLVLTAIFGCLALTASPAGAVGQYLLGVNMTFLSVKPTGKTVVSRVSSDAKGQVSVPRLAPGKYELQIDGPSLVRVMDKLAPQTAIPGSGGTQKATSVPRQMVLYGTYGSSNFSVTSSYCRDSAGRGVRLGFTIPEGGASASLTISLEPANATISE